MENMKTIFLYGPPASGKTTLGRRLASALGMKFVDLDEEIEAASGKTVRQIFDEGGEDYFRELESAALARVVASVGRASVVSLGGGTLLSEENRRLCGKVGSVLCLEAPSRQELERRICADGNSRPLGNRAEERKEHYSSFPMRIARSFYLEGSTVVVGQGIAAALIDGIKFVCDGNVGRLYGELAAPGGGRLFDNCIAEIPSGEEHKTPSTVSSLWSAFAAHGIGRRDIVAAVGGGVTGDLTGFAAATWMRGVPWVNVPTTLLSMVDASTGGKTGCDLPEGKNLAGAFHSPRLVVIDVDFLKTLPPECIADGRAEMIKHEIISGSFGLSVCGVPSAAEIADNLAVKVEIVKEDPLELTGKRMMLNCGHTVGHAVEKASNYSLSHGTSVAIGCVEEAKIAFRRSLSAADWPSRLRDRFAAAGIKTDLPKSVSPEVLRRLMKGDKKRHGETVSFALPCALGDVRIVDIDLSKEEL